MDHGPRPAPAPCALAPCSPSKEAAPDGAAAPAPRPFVVPDAAGDAALDAAAEECRRPSPVRTEPAEAAPLPLGRRPVPTYHRYVETTASDLPPWLQPPSTSPKRRRVEPDAPQHQCAAASPPPPATAPGPAPAPMMMMMMPLAAAAAAGTTPMLTPLRGMSPVNNGASTAALVQEPAGLPRAPDSAACASSFIKRADSVPMMLNAMTTSAVVAAIARAVSG